jgi:hypothetical protein
MNGNRNHHSRSKRRHVSSPLGSLRGCQQQRKLQNPFSSPAMLRRLRRQSSEGNL